MKERMHFKMRIGERIDGDFEIRFESRAIGANVVFNRGNIGRGQKRRHKNSLADLGD